MAADVTGIASTDDVVGACEVFAKTFGESDVTLFAAVSGDFHRNHVDHEYGVRMGYGGRVVHGALLVGLMSAASARLFERLGRPALSYGYDRIRFTRPVRLGDTLTTTYRVVSADAGRSQAQAEVEVVDQKGATVAVAMHLVQFTKEDTQ